MSVRVRLVPMTEAEFDLYEQAEAQEYAAENIRAGYWAEDEAIERARESHRMLLPQGVATPGHHFCHLIDAGARRGWERCGGLRTGRGGRRGPSCITS